MNNILLSCCMLLLFSSTLIASAWYKNLDLSGYIETGLGYRNANYPDATYYIVYNEEQLRIVRSRLELAFDISRHVSADLKFLGDMDRAGVRLQSGSITFSGTGGNILKIGTMKKNLGIEEYRSSEELRTINRSLENELFESYRILGYDFLIEDEIEFRRDSTGKTSLILSAGGDGDTRIFAGGLIEADKGNMDLILSTLFCHHVRYSSSIIATAGTEYENPAIFFSGELFGGNNGFQARLLHYVDLPLSGYFTGIRFIAAPYFKTPWTFIIGIEPLTSSVLLFQDVTSNNEFLLQVTPGINAHIDKKGQTRIMANSEVVYRHFNREFRRISTTTTIQIQVCW